MTSASWEEMCRILSNHFEGNDDCEATLNRLIKKGLGAQGTVITRQSISIYLEQWTLNRLWSTIKKDNDVTELVPHREGDPPIIMRWRGADYRLDGRKRINQLHRRLEQGPHAVLIVDLGCA
jgi:hypothetical protein